MIILISIVVFAALFIGFDQLLHFVPREEKVKFRKLEIYEDYVINPRNGELVFNKPRIKMLN